MLEGSEFWDAFTNKDNLNVAVFGLGSKDYENFNAQGKFFYKVLVEDHKLNLLCALGLGNDQEDIQKDFAEWKDNVFFKQDHISFLKIKKKMRRGSKSI